MTKPTPPAENQTPEESSISADELERLKLGWQRCQADFDNFRKRTERERSELWQMASIEMLLKLTPIADNFRRAFAEENTNTESWKTGIEQIQKQIDELLTANDFVRLTVIGEPFDPNQHEALSQVPHTTIPEGHIIQEIEAGYQYRGTIIKPAKVVVSTGQPE